MTTVRPSPLAVRRHCPPCAVAWHSTDPNCWVCGLPGQPGLLPHQPGRSPETYDGQAPHEGGGTRR